VEEARKRIYLIVEPPEAEVGANYSGKVVNITKFGAFVNILPGRDGLLHISKMGGGRRVERVEDVLSLGQEVEVRVDDIDPQGKVSLSVVGELQGSSAAGGNGAGSASAGSESGRRSGGAQVASFEAAFEAELAGDLGDLGPGPERTAQRGDRGEHGERGERSSDRRNRRPRRR
jgi:polyribonucleotide nucleotidyltransferase